MLCIFVPFMYSLTLARPFVKEKETHSDDMGEKDVYLQAQILQETGGGGLGSSNNLWMEWSDLSLTKTPSREDKFQQGDNKKELFDGGSNYRGGRGGCVYWSTDARDIWVGEAVVIMPLLALLPVSLHTSTRSLA